MDKVMASEIQRSASAIGKVFVLGSYNLDLVYTVDKFPETGQTIMAKGVHSQHGGKGSNQAIASAKAGAKTHFAVKIGDDNYSIAAKSLLLNGMFEEVSLFEQVGCATGTAIVMVSEHSQDNSIIVSSGANNMLTEKEIISCFQTISTSEVLVTQMETNAEPIRIALQHAAKNNVTTILNPAPYREEVKELLPFATYVTPNITEAEEIVGFKIDDSIMTEKAALKIHRMGAANVIITLGSRGCLLYDGVNFEHFSAFPAISIDTSGAGDAFNGALAAMLAKGNDIKSAIFYASAFSSMAVERKGASNMPEHHEVMEKIKKHSEYTGFSANF